MNLKRRIIMTEVEVIQLRDYIRTLLEYANNDTDCISYISTGMRSDAEVVLAKMRTGEDTLEKVCNRSGVKVKNMKESFP